jgi:spermidine synthase
LLAAVVGVGCFWLNRVASPHLALADIRLGALLSATVLLGLPLSLAAAATPTCVRLVARSAESVGGAAGSIYSASTAGGVAATLLAGFWTIPSFGVTATFHAACALLALAAGAAFLLGRKRLPLAAVLVALAPTILLAGRGDGRQAPGVVLMSRQSPYGSIVVVDSLGDRLLFVDGVLQTGLPADLDSIGRGSHLIEERYHLELLAAFRPTGRRALLIGLGGGLFPRVMAGQGVETVSVEIDPVVAEAAILFFGVDGPVVIDDGRRYLRRTGEAFDFIVIDAYAAELPPNHLFSAEMMDLASQHLLPGGIVAINLIADPESIVPRAVCRTLATRFPYQRAHRFRPGPGPQPLTVFASARPLELTAAAFAPGFGRPAAEVLEILRSREVAIDATGAPLITDDRNPVELAWHRDVLVWRQKSNELAAPARFRGAPVIPTA